MIKNKSITDKVADAKALLAKYQNSKKEREERIINNSFEKIIDEVNSLLRNYIDDPYQTIDLNLRVETPLLKNNLHLAEIVKNRCLQHIEFSNIIVLNDGAVFILFVKNA